MPLTCSLPRCSVQSLGVLNPASPAPSPAAPSGLSGFSTPPHLTQIE